MDDCTIATLPTLVNPVDAGVPAGEAQACLIVASAPAAVVVGTVVSLAADGTLIGRHAAPGVFERDHGISRRHARLWIDANGAHRIEDLGSKNGIYLNGRRVPGGVLREGDIVRVGAFTALRFSLRGRADEAE